MRGHMQLQVVLERNYGLAWKYIYNNYKILLLCGQIIGPIKNIYPDST